MSDSSSIDLNNNITYTFQTLTLQPCYFASAEGILSCHSCRAKYVCDKSPEMKLP